MVFKNNLCRTCNTQCNNLVNIFAYGHNQTLPNLKAMLEYCTRTKLNDNSDYPQGMCHNCIKQLQITHRFLNRFFLAQNEFDEAQAYMQDAAADNSSLKTEKDLEECSEDEPMQSNVRLPKNMLLKLTASEKCEQPLVPDEYVETLTEQLVTEIHINKPTASRRPNLESATHAVVCQICHKSFLTTKALNLHLKINHKRKAIST